MIKTTPKVSFLYLIYFVAILAVVTVTFTRNFLNDWKDWSALAVELPIETQRWKVNSSAAKEANETRAPSSYQSSEDLNRSVLEGKKTNFDLVLSISPDEVVQIKKQEAYHFLLGWVSGDLSVRVKDQEIYSAKLRDRKPHQFRLPSSAILEGGLQIFLNVQLPPGSPEAFPLSRGFKEGFMTTPTAHQFERFYDFIEKGKSFALFWVYLMAGFFFFFLWTAQRAHREYFYFACFALLNAFPEIMYGSAFSYNLNQGLAVQIFTLWVFMKVGLALSFGFSLARLAPRFVEWPAILGFMVGLAALTFVPIVELSSTRRTLLQTLLPVSFLSGVIACLWQLYFHKAIMSQSRRIQLTGVSLLLTGLAFVSYWQFRNDLSTVAREILWGVPEFALFALLAAFALMSYRQATKLMSQTPVSKYHRRESLPSQIEGVLLRIDIKNSEKLYRNTENSSLMSTVISHFWKKAEESGGVVLGHNGDELDIFFDRQEDLALQETVFGALAQLRELGESLQVILGADSDVAFRGALVYGRLKPVWTGTQKNRSPAWEQVGETKLFVTAARLFEIEKNFGRDDTLVVVDCESVKQKFPLPLSSSFNFRVLAENQEQTAKHNSIYRVTVLSLLSTSEARTIRKTEMSNAMKPSA